jgi:hypothetical protein
MDGETIKRLERSRISVLPSGDGPMTEKDIVPGKGSVSPARSGGRTGGTSVTLEDSADAADRAAARAGGTEKVAAGERA